MTTPSWYVFFRRKTTTFETIFYFSTIFTKSDFYVRKQVKQMLGLAPVIAQQFLLVDEVLKAGRIQKGGG